MNRPKSDAKFNMTLLWTEKTARSLRALRLSFSKTVTEWMDRIHEFEEYFFTQRRLLNDPVIIEIIQTPTSRDKQ